ncbi:MAG: hypothetical protein HQM14_13115 [SAR324 cluster bacterium]|nr:hypothetical protein [SAR324 cluster bacterium]
MRIFISMLSAFAGFFIVVWLGFAFTDTGPNYTVATLMTVVGYLAGWTIVWSKYQARQETADFLAGSHKPSVPGNPPAEQSHGSEETKAEDPPVVIKEINTVHLGNASSTEPPAAAKSKPSKSPKKTQKPQKTAASDTAGLVSLSDVEQQLSISRKVLNRHIDNLGISKQRKARYVYIHEADVEKLRKEIAKG